MQNKYVILKSPVKIGSYERVASYAGSLTKGEEQILVTRDLKFFLTDGKGGYLEFKSINSGITVDETIQKLNDLNSSLSKNIEDLDTKTNNQIISLHDAVDALNLKFDGYVTTTEFNNLKAQVESNTTIATHTNRDTLDKFSEDTSGNPLFNGTKIVANMEAEIADLNNRSVIGSSLDYGLFRMSEDVTTSSVNEIIPFDTLLSGNIVITNNKIQLKANKKYILTGVLKNVLESDTTGYFNFNFYNDTLKSYIGTTGSSTGNNVIGQQTAKAYIVPTIDTEISLRPIDLTTSVITQFGHSYIEVQEVGRTTIIDPAEDAKKIQFEYGTFKLSLDPTLSENSIVPFDTIVSGNMTLTNNKVELKSGKSYKLETALRAGTLPSGSIIYRLYDYTNNIYINDFWGIIQKEDTWVQQPVLIGRLTPDTDIEVGVIIQSISGVSTISNQMSFLDVEEIAQPYYFNYYKDSIKATTIFEGTAGDITSTFTLTDSVNNYEKLIIHSCCLIDFVKREKASITVNVKDIVFESSDYEFLIGGFATNFFNYVIEIGFKSEKTFKIGSLNSVGWSNPMIYKIEGIGYSYDNPYQDIITTVNEATIKDIQADSDINDIWNEVSR